LFRHWPFNWLVSKYGLCALFLPPKLKWKYSDDVSFTTTPMSLNQLHFIVHKLMTIFLHLKNKVLSYKMNKSIGITCMEEEFVSRQYNMEVTRHRNPIFYEKYFFSIFFSSLHFIYQFFFLPMFVHHFSKNIKHFFLQFVFVVGTMKLTTF
jgi:hypothetical protein